MLAITLLILSGFFVLIFAYPYVVYPWIVDLMARGIAEDFSGAVTLAPYPHTDIVVCAHNEETCLQAKIDNCLRLSERYGNLRIHVYSDGSTDGTNAILAAYGDRIDTIISAQRLGKSAGMNRLVARCTGSFIVFTDANVGIDESRFTNFLAPFADPLVGCVNGGILADNGDEGSVARINARYHAFEERLKLAESRCGSAMGADGALFAIRRELYRQVPADIIDDMFTSLSILCDGHRIIQSSDWLARERNATRVREEFRRKIRIGCRAFNCHRLLWPRLKKLPPLELFKYLSHKLARWLGGVWMLGALVCWLGFCALTGWWWVGLASMAIVVGLLTGSAYLPARLRAVAEALLAIIATSLGVMQSLRGQRYQVWTAAASTRGA